MNRRTFLALMAATGAAGVAGNASAPAHAGGEELRDLPEMSSANGVLDTALDMVTRPVELGGRQLTLETYNGGLPGPILRIRPGDNLRVRLTNQMVPVGIPTNNVLLQPYCASKSNDARYDTRRACVHDLWNKFERADTLLQEFVITNLHTHGLQVSPKDPADNVFLRLDPPFSHQYSYDIPTNQPAGLFWYHPHFHTATAHQAWNGLAGPIIVEGDIDAVPEIAEMRERTLVINGLLIDDDSGEVPIDSVIPIAGPVAFQSIPAVPDSMYFPVNGQLIPDIIIQPGEAQRWRVLNSAPHRSMWLHVEGHTLHQIGTDGTPYRAPRSRPHIFLASANRAEFIIKGGEPGRYRIYAAAYDQGHPGGPRPDLPLATLVVRGKPMNSRLPSTLVEPPRMPNLPVARRRTLVFSGDITGRTGIGVQFLIDGKEYDMERIDQEVEAGTVEEWTIVNEDIFQHPLHIHVNPFQVTDVQGIPPGDTSWLAEREPDVWWDVFRLPPFGRYTLRTYFRPDMTGKTVYHCHILPHEDRGMMGNLLIDPPGAGVTVRRPLLVALMVVAVAAVPATADPAGPSQQPMSNQGRYVFNQQHRDNMSWWNRTWLPQLVPKAALLEVQLPSDPIRWVPYGEPDCQPSPGYDWAEISGSWVPDGPPRHHRVPVQLVAQQTIPNPGRNKESANPYELPGVYVPVKDRVIGSSAISVFYYQLLPEPELGYFGGRGLATICLRPDPIPDDVRVLGYPPDTPPTYVLTLVVGVRQASIGGGLPPTPLPAPPEVRPEPDLPSGPNEPQHG